MQFLLVLVVATALAWAFPANVGGRSLKEAMRRAMGVAFVFAGASHLLMPESFSVYFPPATPFVDGVVIVSGVVEILAGLALLGSWRRRQLGIAVAVYLVLVFPANLYVAVSGAESALPGLIDAPWYPWVRLPFQALFIWWALYSTSPSKARRASAPPVPRFGESSPVRP
jgi:uncharacterized membrane protein